MPNVDPIMAENGLLGWHHCLDNLTNSRNLRTSQAAGLLSISQGLSDQILLIFAFLNS